MAYCLQYQRIPSQSFQQQSKKCEYKLLQSLNVPPSTNLFQTGFHLIPRFSQDLWGCAKNELRFPGPLSMCPGRPFCPLMVPETSKPPQILIFNWRRFGTVKSARGSLLGSQEWLKTGFTIQMEAHWKSHLETSCRPGFFWTPQWSSAK